MKLSNTFLLCRYKSTGIDSGATAGQYINTPTALRVDYC